MNFEERLIYAVEKNPIIYDKSIASYKSCNARDIAWQSIAKELKSQGKKIRIPNLFNSNVKTQYRLIQSYLQ